MEQANNSLPPFPFTRAEIPEGDALEVEVLGVDQGSYFHISFCHPDIKESYKKMLDKMQEQVRGRYCMPSRLAERTGMETIIEHPGRRGGSYVRGTVVKSIPWTNLVRCKLVDDAVEVEVHRSQLYHTSLSVLHFPKFVLKCKLAGMECFLNHPYLQALFLKSMKSESNTGGHGPFYTAQVLDGSSQVPTIRLTTSLGKDLTDLLQQYIPTTGRLEYPAFGMPISANITFCDVAGNVWFQPVDKNSLLKVIATRLRQYTKNNTILSDDKRKKGSSWTDHFFKGPGQLFVYKRHDGKAHRVRKLDVNEDGTTQILYVDFGKIENAPEDQLIAAKLIDPNLCFIPPQCLPIRFIGVECYDKVKKEFNLDRFWKYADLQPCFIVLRDFSACTDCPCVFQQDRVLPANFLDPHLNFLAPPCVPVRMLSSGLGNICQQLTLQQFFRDAKDQPVSAILEQYDIQFGIKGKFLGGIIPPEADILVKYLDTDETASDEPTVVMNSLYEIYHTKEHCFYHDSANSSDSGVGCNNAECQRESDDKCNSPDSFDSAILVDSQKSKSNWVDWAMKTIGDYDDDTVDTVSYSMSPSPGYLNDLNKLTKKPKYKGIEAQVNQDCR